MKKYIFIFAIFMFLLFTSCVPEPFDPPLGVWRSENPDITLYLNENQYILHQLGSGLRHFGIYIKNGEELRIFPTFGTIQQFNIRYNIRLSPRGHPIIDDVLISGNWRLVRDQLHFIPNPSFQEHHSIEVIIFDRIEEYDPINPEDWITPEIEILIEDLERRARERQERMANQEQISSDE